MSRQLVAEERFPEAIDNIGSALLLDPNNADYLVQRADLLQATQRMPEAAEMYRRFLALRDDARARTNLELCEKLLARDGAGAPLSRASQILLADGILKQEGRALDAVPLCKLIGRESETAMPRIKERLKRIATLPGWDWNRRLRLRENGTYSLNLGGLPKMELPALGDLPVTELDLNGSEISDLRPLRGMRLSILNLNVTPVVDLRPLTGMPLTRLVLERTRVTDLSPLRGAPLERLQILGTPISDLTPLIGMPLKHLQAGGTPIIDLSPLSDLPLKWLGLSQIPARDFSPLANTRLQEIDLEGTHISDLSFVRGLPLKNLILNGCSELHDLRPLSDCESLEELAIPNTNRDLSFLKSHPNLKRIGVNENPIDRDEFWNRYDAANKLREKAYAALRKMGVPDAPERVTTRTDGKLDLNLTRLRIIDFSPLRGLAIRKLEMFQTEVQDLNQFAELDLEDLRLPYCPNLKDLSPLRRSAT